MNADDLAVRLYAELQKRPHDAREFLRSQLEQLSTAELAEIVGASNDAGYERRLRLVHSATESR